MLNAVFCAIAPSLKTLDWKQLKVKANFHNYKFIYQCGLITYDQRGVITNIPAPGCLEAVTIFYK